MFKFKIESLNYMSCFHNIEQALKEVDGSITAKADIRKQILSVESNSIPVDEVKEIIEKAGYEVSAVIET